MTRRDTDRAMAGPCSDASRKQYSGYLNEPNRLFVSRTKLMELDWMPRAGLGRLCVPFDPFVVRSWNQKSHTSESVLSRCHRPHDEFRHTPVWFYRNSRLPLPIPPSSRVCYPCPASDTSFQFHFRPRHCSSDKICKEPMAQSPTGSKGSPASRKRPSA
jgi:hypothetical protein